MYVVIGLVAALPACPAFVILHVAIVCFPCLSRCKVSLKLTSCCCLVVAVAPSWLLQSCSPHHPFPTPINSNQESRESIPTHTSIPSILSPTHYSHIATTRQQYWTIKLTFQEDQKKQGKQSREQQHKHRRAPSSPCKIEKARHRASNKNIDTHTISLRTESFVDYAKTFPFFLLSFCLFAFIGKII
jgi:hypothetical protein